MGLTAAAAVAVLALLWAMGRIARLIGGAAHPRGDSQRVWRLTLLQWLLAVGMLATTAALIGLCITLIGTLAAVLDRLADVVPWRALGMILALVVDCIVMLAAAGFLIGLPRELLRPRYRRSLLLGNAALLGVGMIALVTMIVYGAGVYCIAREIIVGGL